MRRSILYTVLGAVAVAAAPLIRPGTAPAAGARTTAEDPQAPDSQISPLTLSLADSCAGCHGDRGRSLGAMPTLAGRPYGEIVSALREFRAGTRSGTIMPRMAKGIPESQFEPLAHYFSRIR